MFLSKDMHFVVETEGIYCINEHIGIKMLQFDGCIMLPTLN